MKKAQIKTIMLSMLILLLGAMSVFALTVTLNSPTSTWETSGSSVFNFTPDAEVSSIPWCAIYTNSTGTYKSEANYTNVVNGTPFVRGLGLADSTGLSVVWNAICYNGSAEVSDSGNNTFGVDSNLPTITLNSPASGSYIDATLTNLSITVSDSSNLEACVMWSNISGTWALNKTFASVTSGSIYGFNLSSSSDGNYVWNAVCNQTSGDSTTSSNFTVTVDTTAPLDIKMGVPTNNTFSTDNTPTIGWNQTTEINFDEYVVYLSTNLSDLSDTVIAPIHITTITSNTTTITTTLPDDTYYIWVEASDLAGNAVNVTDIYHYTVNSASPTITITSPADNAYQNNVAATVGYNGIINITPTDADIDTCILNIDGSLNYTQASLTTATATLMYFNSTDGEYKWNVKCNNSAGANTSTVNRTITIDTTDPTQPNITSTWHQTNSTDTTPTLLWQTSTDTNFDKYVVEAINVSSGNVEEQINVTVNTTTFIGLGVDTTYNFSVTAYDLAGNTKVSGNTTDTWYYVDSVCGTLYAGWNVCGAVSTTLRNLSVIGAETGATMVTVWNSSHEWQTCLYGVSGANCDEEVGVDSNNFTAVWIYVESETLWEDRTWSAVDTTADVTLTNTSTSGWNIFGMFKRNGLNFGELNATSRLSNTNVSAYSFKDNSVGTNTPYITQSGYNSINKGTEVKYGEALWVMYNTSASSTFDVGSW